MMAKPESITRFYRQWMKPKGLTVFHVIDQQSDLLIAADKDLTEKATKILREVRQPLEEYVEKDDVFLTTLEPYETPKDAPAIAGAMAEAGRTAGVGPMAAVAGAVAEALGRALLPYTKEVIVENGGDIFLATRVKRVVGVYAGEGHFHSRLGIELPPCPNGFGIATSSSTLSVSLSLGKADAGTVMAETATLADACATALCNRVKEHKDLKPAVEWCVSLPGVKGALAVLQNALAVEGEGFQLIPL